MLLFSQFYHSHNYYFNNITLTAKTEFSFLLGSLQLIQVKWVKKRKRAREQESKRERESKKERKVAKKEAKSKGRSNKVEHVKGKWVECFCPELDTIFATVLSLFLFLNSPFELFFIHS